MVMPSSMACAASRRSNGSDAPAATHRCGRWHHGSGRVALNRLVCKFFRNPNPGRVRQRQFAGGVLQRDLPDADVADIEFVCTIVDRRPRQPLTASLAAGTSKERHRYRAGISQAPFLEFLIRKRRKCGYRKLERFALDVACLGPRLQLRLSSSAPASPRRISRAR